MPKCASSLHPSPHLHPHTRMGTGSCQKCASFPHPSPICTRTCAWTQAHAKNAPHSPIPHPPQHPHMHMGTGSCSTCSTSAPHEYACGIPKVWVPTRASNVGGTPRLTPASHSYPLRTSSTTAPTVGASAIIRCHPAGSSGVARADASVMGSAAGAETRGGDGMGRDGSGGRNGGRVKTRRNGKGGAIGRNREGAQWKRGAQ
eukprot:353456-Chlamydomonas_euryale.AAC.3